ncbi:ABC transporter permease [Mesorhizobium sp.]|uniref:ABC transporter permease n=1 Tax=Mesorhizobium sp. TaxID=1871066 RepID=UPI000FE4747F|nr:ABC transporter permease [Mesorhizobium sp.]RWI87935.1 MAG: ABC transporter permease [Mesorhizobium sp.]
MNDLANSHKLRATACGVALSLFSFGITLFGLLLVTFLIGRTMPIDPVIAIAGDRASPDVVARIRTEMGLDRSLPEQFWIYLEHVGRGDLGKSVMTTSPVTQDLANFFPATFELATTAILIAIGFGIPLGVWAASRRGSYVDKTVRLLSLFGQSIPIFVLGLLALLVFYVKLNLAPGTGRQDIIFQGTVPRVTGFISIDALITGDLAAFQDALAHLILPSLVLATFSLAIIARMTRSFMLDALASEFIVTAKAKGLSWSRTLWRHALPSVVAPLLTVIAMTYAMLLEGAVLTETVFSWPGLGLYLTTSLLNADMNAVLGATLVIGTVYLALNTLSDVASHALDPRIQ